MIQRAYGLIDHVKSAAGSTDGRSFTGIATSISTDRMGDSIDPKGVKAAKTLPLLLYHDSKRPVGEVTFGKATQQGIPFTATISKIDRAGTVQDRLNEAADSLNANPPLIRGVSIGFRPLADPTYNKETGGFDFSEVEVLELSMVVIPANQDATIHAVKSLDVELAAPGVRSSSRKSPGVSGSTRVVTTGGDSTMRKSYADQIASFEATRAAKSAQMDAIMEKSAEAGATLDASEKEAYDTLAGEVKEVDEHLVRLRDAEARQKSVAVAVVGTGTGEAVRERATGVAGSRLVVIPKNLPPGLRFTRYAMAMAQGRGSVSDAKEWLQRNFPDDTELVEFAKTAVAGGTTANGGGPLLQYTDIMSEFIDYLRPLTILGKFGTGIYPNVTRVPFNVRVGTQTAGGSASWVGEGKPKPLTKGTFSTATLDFAKVACISVLTKEEVRFPSISSQEKVRNDLTKAIVARIDTDLVDPANLGTASVKPAAITANLVGQVPSGTTAAAFAVDLKTLLSGFLTNNIQVSSLVLIMSQIQALSLSLMRTSLGVKNFPDITMNGGYLEGIPVIVSEAITAVGSPSTGMIVALNAADLFLADDGNVTVDASDQASLEMSDAPAQDGTTGGGASMVSLWQTNMLGLRAEREINWKLMRAASAAYITVPAYVPQ